MLCENSSTCLRDWMIRSLFYIKSCSPLTFYICLSCLCKLCHMRKTKLLWIFILIHRIVLSKKCLIKVLTWADFCLCHVSQCEDWITILSGWPLCAWKAGCNPQWVSSSFQHLGGSVPCSRLSWQCSEGVLVPLPATRTLSKVCPHWCLDQEPYASQLSPLGWATTAC